MKKSEFYSCFIKVCQKRDYAEQIAQGSLYMSASGYFRKAENDFRDDVNEGLLFTDPCAVAINGVNLSSMGLAPSYVTLGYVGDEKYPIFCCTLITDDILGKSSEGFALKETIITELEQFGDYCILFQVGEFLSKLKEALETYKGTYRYGPVKYVDKKTLYNDSVFYKIVQKPIDYFFIKDKLYSYQNEWRLVLAGEDGQPPLAENVNHFVLKMKPLVSMYIGDSKKTLHGLIKKITTEDEVAN